MAQWQSGVVQQHIHWDETFHSLQITTTSPLAFKAGQYTRVGLEIDGGLVARPYSFVNPPTEPQLEFYFNTVPDGPLSNRLAQLEIGDSLEIATPVAGFMVLDELPQGRDLWLFATGTAIGPYLSMLGCEELWRQFDRVLLVWGTPFNHQQHYAPVLHQFAERHGDRFRWLACLSREPLAETFDTPSLPDSAARLIYGRMTTALEDGQLEQQLGVQLAVDISQVLLCGNPAMVKEMLLILKRRGLTKNLRRNPGQVTVERYW
ncbi:MAG: ferredoxin--NADP reductase [Motiliproteus sp.]